MRMGRVSWLTRRPLPPVTHTHALFAGQSHSIRDNLMALLGHSRAWNCLADSPSPVCLVRRLAISQQTGCTRGALAIHQVRYWIPPDRSGRQREPLAAVFGSGGLVTLNKHGEN